MRHRLPVFSPPRRILVPVDFSPSAEAALGYALLIADGFDGEVDVLHVVDTRTYAGTEAVIVHPPGAPIETLADYVHHEEQTQLDTFVARWKEQRARLRPFLVRGDPLLEILERTGDHDLVVMGSHGRGAIAHLFLGSVAEQVVRKARCPVVTLRAETQA